MTPEEINVARHALGLPNMRGMSYRNHFVTGKGDVDYRHWQALVARGFARELKGSVLTGGDPCFLLTRAGATAVLKGKERLDPEDFPPTTVTPAKAGDPETGGA